MYPGKISNMKALTLEMNRLDAERDYLEYELRRVIDFYKQDYKSLARDMISPVVTQYRRISSSWRVLNWLIKVGWRTGWLKYFVRFVVKKLVTYLLQFAGIKLLLGTLKKQLLRKRALPPQSAY